MSTRIGLRRTLRPFTFFVQFWWNLYTVPKWDKSFPDSRNVIFRVTFCEIGHFKNVSICSRIISRSTDYESTWMYLAPWSFSPIQAQFAHEFPSEMAVRAICKRPWQSYIIGIENADAKWWPSPPSGANLYIFATCAQPDAKICSDQHETEGRSVDSLMSSSLR